MAEEVSVTQTRFTFELNMRRGKGDSPGLSVADPMARRSGTITLPAGNNTIIAPFNLEYCFEKIQRAEFVITAATDAGIAGARCTTWVGLDGWYIERNVAGTPPAFFANGAGDPTIWETDVNGDRKDVLQVTGAAATALSDLTGPLTLSYETSVSRTNYFPTSPGSPQQSSPILFDDFADDMLGDVLPNLASVCIRRLKTIQNAGNGLLLLAEQGNQKITVPSVCAALGFQQPIIVNADIGIGFGQIPAASASWTVDTFKPHPRLFVRGANNTGWQIKQLAPSPISNPPPITSDTANLYPLLATRRPSHSAWRIGLDGCLMDVIVAHPPLPSDLRRPRDIWRGVWAPAIESNTPLPIFSYYFIGIAPNLGRNFYSRGILTGLEYLDFAYCLDEFDVDGGNPLIEFPQI